MRRLILIITGFICFIHTLQAQQEPLVIQGVAPELYIIHNPVAKENFYSLARLYNVPPKEIAAYNNLVFENGLRLGQPVKIPLTQNNFIQSLNTTGNKAETPVYHTVEAKEGLYRVSVNYNKVPLEQLKKWNHLSSDVVSSGTKLIVGYLKVQDEAAQAGNITTIKKEVPAPAKNDQPVVKTNDSPNESLPAAKNTDVANTPGNAANTPAFVKEETQVAGIIPVTHTAINFNGGAFKKLYDDQQSGSTAVAENGASGVFKSTSGWRDGKYYCFHNSAPAGTIVKITNSANGKSVYAKVLDLIPDINQNAGLILHVSNAAAEELGIIANRFDCSLSYSKLP